LGKFRGYCASALGTLAQEQFMFSVFRTEKKKGAAALRPDSFE